jgi:hypothetical protein
VVTKTVHHQPFKLPIAPTEKARPGLADAETKAPAQGSAAHGTPPQYTPPEGVKIRKRKRQKQQKEDQPGQPEQPEQPNQ